MSDTELLETNTQSAHFRQVDGVGGPTRVGSNVVMGGTHPRADPPPLGEAAQTSNPARPVGLVALALAMALASPAAWADEVDFRDLPFGATHQEVEDLSPLKSLHRPGRDFHQRIEMDMRFAGAQLAAVYYGFENEQLAVVEAETPLEGARCIHSGAAQAIAKRAQSLFGRPIRRVSRVSSPEEYRRNVADYRECVASLPGEEDVSCSVAVFEVWKGVDEEGGDDGDRALDVTLQEISIGKATERCMVRIVFRQGRTLGEKRAQEEADTRSRDALLEMLGPP